MIRRSLMAMRRLLRLSLLVMLVAAGTLMLVRFSPGYFADSREMDAQYAATARTQLEQRQLREQSAAVMAYHIAGAWLHGRLGVSRQYGVPVGELILPRAGVTARLLAGSIAIGWLCAAAIALPLSARRHRAGEGWITAGSAVLLAMPIGALATVFLMTNVGGPALAIGVLLTARDFKFLYRLLDREWRAPYLLIGRAQGISTERLVMAHLLPQVLPQLRSLMTMSFVVALSMTVPAEVLFDVPGLGQLAWSAAMNRDLPLLLAVTLIMAIAVGCAELVSEPAQMRLVSQELA